MIDPLVSVSMYMTQRYLYCSRVIMFLDLEVSAKNKYAVNNFGVHYLEYVEYD